MLLQAFKKKKTFQKKIFQTYKCSCIIKIIFHAVILPTRIHTIKILFTFHDNRYIYLIIAFAVNMKDTRYG